MDTAFPRPLCQDNSQRGSGEEILVPGCRELPLLWCPWREGSAHPEECLLALFDPLTQGLRWHLAMSRLWVASPAPFSSSSPSHTFFKKFGCTGS